MALSQPDRPRTLLASIQFYIGLLVIIVFTVGQFLNPDVPSARWLLDHWWQYLIGLILAIWGGLDVHWRDRAS